MQKSISMILSVLMATMSVPTTAFADSTGEGNQPPETPCSKPLMRDIYKHDTEQKPLIDAIEARYIDKTDTKGSDTKFCQWVSDTYDGKTTADWCHCGDDVPKQADLERSGIDDDVRYKIRETAKPQSNGFGDLLSSPFMGALLGGGIGALLGGWLSNRNNNNNNYRRYPPARWPAGMSQYGYNQNLAGVPLYNPNGGAVRPYLGTTSNGIAPGIIQLNQTGVSNLGYQMSPGIVSTGSAPSVLPLLPQSNFSVIGGQTANYPLI